MLFSGISTSVVTPPAAAARVADSKPSQSVRPGSLMCTCVSTRPGKMKRSPASRSTSRGENSPVRTAAMVPPRVSISAGPMPSGSTTRRLRMITGGTLACGSSGDRRLDEAVRLVRGDEDLVAVFEAETGQVDRKVVLVRHDQVNHRDIRDLGEHGVAHRVHRVLNRGAVVGGEGFEQDLSSLA